MADLRPFRAFRPRRDVAPRVAAPPYDVVSTKEARALVAAEPASFLHVSRAEVDLPEGVDEHDQQVHDKARDNLLAMVEEGLLVQDDGAHLYLYAQTMGAHRQVGVVACASVAEYDDGRIKKHEKTRADKEDDRTRHVEALGAHDEPVFLTYRASAAVDRVVAEATRAPAALDFTTPDGVRHEVWVLSRETTSELASAFRDVPALYVADGHHRSAAASRVHARLRGDGGEHDAFLAVVFPHDQMQIMAYNRLVRDPQRRTPEELLLTLSQLLDFDGVADDGGDPRPTEPKQIGVYLGGRWRRARFKAGTWDPSDPVASLDASICQETILRPVFAVDDPRRDAHVDFVGGIRGPEELERRVASGEFDVAIHLYPTRIEELIAVSDAGLLMPPKSTWFEPKLRSGLFVHTF
jgi:uncharacterized protein (DUF1015 family)